MAETRPMRTSFYGNGKLWTILPPRMRRGGVFAQRYGELATAVQINWWEMGRGLLTIKGTRLDGPAEPLHVNYGGWGGGLREADEISHVNRTVIFPTQGCWEITGEIYDINDSALTFVVEVRHQLHSLASILANKGYGDVTHNTGTGIVHGAMPVDGIQGLSRHLILP
jgi:hypothetical protein